jgi:hypothetical protein
MTYTFHKVQCHEKIPTLTGWYLQLIPYDIATLLEVHLGVTAMYFHRFQHDPHMQKDETTRRIWNPITQAQRWLGSMHDRMKDNKTVLINMNGGWMFMEDAIILDTVTSENIRWGDRYDTEIITISRWPKGRHFYLSSNKFRVFLPDKHNTYIGAFEDALQYVPSERIKSNC